MDSGLMSMSHDKKKVTMLLPRSLWRDVRVAAASKDKTVTDLVQEWLDRCVRQNKQAAPGTAPPEPPAPVTQ